MQERWNSNAIKSVRGQVVGCEQACAWPVSDVELWLSFHEWTVLKHRRQGERSGSPVPQFSPHPLPSGTGMHWDQHRRCMPPANKISHEYCNLFPEWPQVPTCAESTNKGVNQCLKDITQTQQQSSESPTVALNWHASKYNAQTLQQRYILSLQSKGISTTTEYLCALHTENQMTLFQTPFFLMHCDLAFHLQS